MAVGTRFDGVDLDKGITDRERNALDECRPTGVIRENREANVLSRAIEFALSDIHRASLLKRR